ncbi:MAG: phosphoribosylamine--glycine ligase [Bacteroidota bacterium]
MNILILGSGGREHAFAWKLSQSPLCKKLFVAPGNAGTATIAVNVNIGFNEFDKIADFCLESQINLLIVGPEEPLVKGIRDFFESKEELSSIKIIGPDKAGAMLEGSKEFSKNFMHKYGIPTADSATFVKETYLSGITYLETCNMPIVLKADGLAAGKGVIIAQNISEAKMALEEMLLKSKFGKASEKVVIETFLKGIELSVFVLSDGENYKILPEAKDYKRIGENDTGPNTGGMGAVSPVPFASKKFMDMVEKRVVKPTMEGLKKEGIKFVGFIFVGLMNCEGEPYVIEYNVRMGDPETEVVLPRIESDMVSLLLATANGTLNEVELTTNPMKAVTTVVVAGGYPDEYKKGDKITGFENNENCLVFHAGTSQKENEVVTNGGRVIAITGLSNSLEGAIAKSQKGAKDIVFEGKYYRKDIGLDILRSN